MQVRPRGAEARASVRGAVCLALAAAVSACTPTFDWRAVRPEGAALEVLFPCRPLSDQRPTALGDRRVDMMLLACHAGGVMFAVGQADMVDPAAVPTALQALQQSTERRITAAVVTKASAAVPSMTPQPGSLRSELRGTLPDGRPAQVQSVVFAYGTHVYQASVWGTAPAGVAEAFLDSLRVLP